MKKTRHFIKRKILKTRRVLLRARTERPALFTALVILFFSFGGLLVWGGATITTTLFSNNLTQGLVAHYAFDGGDLSGPNPNILFVVGANPLNAADQYLHDIMTLDMGSSVTVLLASANAPTYFTPYDVVVISESSLSVDVASKYNNAGIGVVNMENASWAAHDLVGGDTTVTATTSVNVVGGDHPVAAGYSGTTTLFTSAAQMRRNSVALPAEAVSIMQETGDSSRHIAFAYEKGATMLNAHTAEARRVALGFHSDTYSVFGQPAKDIFMAAVRWAANTTLEESITIRETGEFMGSTTLAAPVGEGNSNHGPYVAHGKQWIFFSNGAGGFVYKTKDLRGGTWSAPSSSYSSYIGQSRYFNITFDGTYFHLFYRISGDGIYRRFTPHPDGTVTADSTHVIYSDATWDLSYSDFYITTDYQGRPWVQFQVTDGVNYKSVVSASTATDGTWSTRSGFPYDLQGSSTSSWHGGDPSIVELGNDEMLFTWRDVINDRMSARVWNNGTWNATENTGLPQATYARTSNISPASGEVLVNAFTTVAHRATNGTWSDRSPGGMNTSSDNSFSKAGDTVRLWDVSGNDIRYKETSDAGLTWGPITTFVTAASAPQFTSTSEIDDYHTVVWAEGINPYVRFAGIDGEIISGNALAQVADRSGNENHGTVGGGVLLESGRIGQAAEFNGKDGYVSAGNIGSNIRSISFWMKPKKQEIPIVRLSDSASIDIGVEPQASSITYVGQTTAAATTATLPAHQAGDLILAWAYRDGNEENAPLTPDGWAIVGEATGNLQSAVVAWKIAENSGTVSGTWFAASNLVFQVYRGVDQNRPIGAFNFETGVSTTVSYPDLAMRQTNGTSWVAGFSGHRETNTSLETVPTGMTHRANVVNSTISEASGHDTNGSVSSWSNQNVSVGGTSSGWLGATVEILSEFTSGPAEGNISYVSGASGVNSLTMPSHQEGDLLLMWAYRDGSTTPPTVPAGWTALSRRGSSSTNSAVSAYKIATSGSETSGTWTNATSVIVGVYRNVDQYTPIGGEIHAAGTAGLTFQPIEYPYLSLVAGNSDRSWLVAFAGYRNIDGAVETPPTGMVNRVNVVDATDEASLHDTNGVRTSNWPTTDVVTNSASYVGYQTSVIEIMGAAQKALPPAITTTGITSPTIYVNGVPDSDVTINEWQHVVITTTSDISASDLMIGRNGDSYFSGQIDDVRIYDTTLSSSDVNRIYHLGATTTINTSLNPPELQVGLVGYWPFNGFEMNWVRKTSNAAWSQRTRAQATLSYNNLLWVMGGWDGASAIGDVWYSADGSNWTLATNSPAWGAKATHEALVYDSKMWVIGGGDKSVYSSTDGVTWTQVTASAPWSGTFRNQHQVVVYDGKMWMMGGTNGTNQNDVWWSTDGVNWTQATANAAWSDRQNHRVVVYDGRMWVVGGGSMLDVWYSTDGATWTQATSNGGWGGSARYRHGLVVHDDKMWIYGGNNGSGATSDVWWSTNGVNWIQETNAAPWGPREEHGFTIHDNQMWLLGGMSTSGNFNDVWSKEVGTLMKDWSVNNNNGIYAIVEGTPPAPITITSRVNTGSDDAEEAAAGSVEIASTDLELVRDGTSNNQDVGMRFTNITIPAGATITDASVQFTVDEITSEATSVTIYGEDIDDAPTFTTATHNISGRIYTTASVSWNSIPSWSTVGLAGASQETPNLSSIIQEIVDRPGWSSGNDVVIIIEGTGVRTAESYDGSPSTAPLLSVTYEMPGETMGGVATGRIGQGVKFSGTTNNIATIQDDDSLDIGSGSFTYGAWIKPDAFVGAYDMPISKGGASAGDTGWDMELGTDGWGAGISDGTIVRIVFFNDNGFSPPYLPAGQWYHLMAVVDRSSNEFRAYRDGVLINTTSITGFGTSNSTKDLTLGGRPGGTPELFNGVIDDLRVYNRALSSAEIDRLYRLGATTKVNTTLPAESSAGGPIAHWTFDGPTISGSTVQDVAGTSNGTLFGASATPGRVGQALSLDGVDDYVNMGNPAALVFGTGDFSYCYWLKTRATSGQPVGKGVWNFRAWGTYITDGRVRFEVKVEDPPGTSFTADTAVINDGVWYHLCGTHDRDGLLSVYTNGNLSNTTNMSAGASYGMLTSNDFLIGDGFPGHFEGAIDDVRVYDRVLSEEEVQRLASLAPSSGGSIAVNAAPPAATGFITVERWDNVSGGLVSDIPVGTTPDYTGTLSTMESPFTGDLYGVRIRGYIYPETTGNYTFWLASDDGGALNLSTDDTEGNKVTIASHSSWTGSREWNKFTSQQSAPIALVAGQRYYIEALQKENAGGDNLAVAWKLNDTTDPVNGSADNIIPGSVLSEWE